MDSETQFGEFPSMVAIFKEELSEGCKKKLVFRCSGSLIKKNVILTVAHCVVWLDISTLIVRAGEWDLETDKEILNHQDRRVTKVLHPINYKGDFYNDFALVFTKYSFSLQDNIQLICLPSEDDIIIKDKCYTSGWSKTVSYNKYTIVKETESGKTKETGQYKVSILKKYGLTMIPQKKCSIPLNGPQFVLHDSYICVDGIKDMCRNDNGSPYMCPYKDDPDRLVQVGIVVHCGKANTPGTYINVVSFMPWIKNTIYNRPY
ncbi:unnamed protein product [Macrosiphum euphorbiae]|uniref:Peptidase S1 domain-containing protein n=1 Tax=Macrosiphum euphorbiae TaxID=13131 RepID=A0AAV0VFY6_9HEMI|nr:unnamed protein product [Macrosiphum euphorbiae]